MSTPWQDRDFGEHWEIEPSPELTKKKGRYSRSIYTKKTGIYIGETSIIPPIIIIIFGTLFLIVGVIGSFTIPETDLRSLSLLMGLICGGTCNLMGILAAIPYFTGVAYQPTSSGGGLGSDNDTNPPD